MSKKNKYQITPQEDKMLKKMFWRSWILFGSFNMVKMQGTGYAQAMMPAIEEFYKNPEDKREALRRSNSFFNCTYETAPFIMGLNASMEKANSEYLEFDTESINAVKASLLGPLSGIGDSIFWGTIRLVAVSIALPLAMKWSILGPILFLLAYHIPSIITRYKLLYAGYTSGEGFIRNAYKSGSFESITYCATLVGMIMIGAMAAQSVTITTPLVIPLGQGEPLVVQTILDQIMPGLLGLGTVLGTFALVRKKFKISYLLLGIMAIGILGGIVGIF